MSVKQCRAASAAPGGYVRPRACSRSLLSWQQHRTPLMQMLAPSGPSECLSLAAMALEATAQNSTAIGNGAKANFSNATAVGQGAVADTEDTTAVGAGALANGPESTAIGHDAQATGSRSPRPSVRML